MIFIFVLFTSDLNNANFLINNWLNKKKENFTFFEFKQDSYESLLNDFFEYLHISEFFIKFEPTDLRLLFNELSKNEKLQNNFNIFYESVFNVFTKRASATPFKKHEEKILICLLHIIFQNFKLLTEEKLVKLNILFKSNPFLKNKYFLIYYKELTQILENPVFCQKSLL